MGNTLFFVFLSNLLPTLIRELRSRWCLMLNEDCCRLCFVQLPISNSMQIQLGVLQTDMVCMHNSGACPHKDITNSMDADALQYKGVSIPITCPHINLRPITQDKMQNIRNSFN